MKHTFNANVIETRKYRVVYLVEGDDEQEAVENAEAGETLRETAGRLYDITDRLVESIALNALNRWEPTAESPEHPNYPVSKWRVTVGTGDTVLGYAEWVNAEIARTLEEEEQATLAAPKPVD